MTDLATDIGIGAAIVAFLAGYWCGHRAGSGSVPPTWAETRVLDAWSIGREAGRREVLMAARALRVETNFHTRVDPGQQPLRRIDQP